MKTKLKWLVMEPWQFVCTLLLYSTITVNVVLLHVVRLLV